MDFLKQRNNAEKRGKKKNFKGEGGDEDE